MSNPSLFAQNVFKCRQRSLNVYSDVADEDGRLTTFSESAVTCPYHFKEIRHPLEASYYLELIVDLNQIQREKIAAQLSHVDNDVNRLHPDNQALFNECKKTDTALANKAWRTGNGKNGDDFYVGITFGCDEVYGVPAQSLTYLIEDFRELYRIPTDTYFGKSDQFRSAKVVHIVRTNPKNLELLYKVDTRRELHEVLDHSRGDFPLPEQKHEVQQAFFDYPFGNGRLRAKNLEKTLQEIAEKKNAHGVVGINVNGETYYSHLCQENGCDITCLREVPDGKIGIYVNSNDECRGSVQGDTRKRAGYLEVVIKGGSANERLDNPIVGTEYSFVSV